MRGTAEVKAGPWPPRPICISSSTTCAAVVTGGRRCRACKPTLPCAGPAIDTFCPFAAIAEMELYKLRTKLERGLCRAWKCRCRHVPPR